MFKKILIANRGEIALRVIRACREMGIASVAVYSDADARAPHVREADEAVLIGPPPSAESYLKGERIIEAAAATRRRGDPSRLRVPVGARVVLARGARRRPRRSSARRPKRSRRWAARPPRANSRSSANVPVVPGTTEALANADEARAIAETVRLSGAAQGGGRRRREGHARRSRRPRRSRRRSMPARREAKNAFGDDAVYVEKYIVGPRHVEIQVLGDQHGTMLSLNERECSVQRRHQKMIEEAPSVAVTPELRRAMGETAVRAASAAGT